MSRESEIRDLVDAVERMDRETLQDWFADEVTEIGTDRSYSRERVLESIDALDAALSDIEYEVREIWTGEETDAFHVGVSGTFDEPYRMPEAESGEVLEFEPTGEDVAGSAVYLLRFDEDGTVTEMASHGYTEMMLDMGVIEYGTDLAPGEGEAEPQAAED